MLLHQVIRALLLIWQVLKTSKLKVNLFKALVSEPIKPIINTVVMSNAVHAYVSQSDKGELVIGAGTDSYVSYTQKGTHEIVEGTLNAIFRTLSNF